MKHITMTGFPGNTHSMNLSGNILPVIIHRGNHHQTLLLDYFQGISVAIGQQDIKTAFFLSI